MKRISELDNLTDAQIQNTDLLEVGRTTAKNFKFTWSSLKTALTTLFDTLYAALTHKTRHQAGGADAINVAGLSGELVDNQPPKAHKTSHQLAGADALNVGGLSGELADNQPPKTHKTSHQSTGADEISVANLSGELTDEQKPKEHSNTKHSTNLVGEAGVIAAMTEKTTPVSNDLFVIEDSAAANAVKKVKLSNLPGAEYADKVAADFTYGETIAVNEAVYLKAADGKVYKTDADFNDERIHNFVGFAKEAGNADDVKKVQTGGIVSGFSGLTIGNYYFLSATAGEISITQGKIGLKRAGLAVSATELLLFDDIISPRGWKAGNTIRAEALAEKSMSGSSYTKVKEIRVLGGGELRFTWDMKCSDAFSGDTTYGKIYRDGAEVGVQKEVTGNTWTERSDDVTGWKTGDLAQLYILNASNRTSYIRNFRIKADIENGWTIVLD